MAAHHRHRNVSTREMKPEGESIHQRKPIQNTHMHAHTYTQVRHKRVLTHSRH